MLNRTGEIEELGHLVTISICIQCLFVCQWSIDLKSTLLLQRYLMTCSEYFTQCCMLSCPHCEQYDPSTLLT